jgi:hypothetical protein
VHDGLIKGSQTTRSPEDINGRGRDQRMSNHTNMPDSIILWNNQITYLFLTKVSCKGPFELMNMFFLSKSTPSGPKHLEKSLDISDIAVSNPKVLENGLAYH